MMSEETHGDFIGRVVNKLAPFSYGFYLRYRTLINYIFAGGTAALVNLVSLYFLTEVLGLWYLFSAVAAFLLAFLVSFYLQKHCTFRDFSKDGVHKQASTYLFVQVINLLINTALMYFWVDIVGLWYMSAQVLTSVIIAVESFFIYKSFIFNGGYQKDPHS